MGGLFTFEATNAAFGTAKDGFHFEPMGDTVFIAICVLMITIGARSINERSDIAAWVRRLSSTTHGPHLTIPASEVVNARLPWCLLLGLAFYLYFGIAPRMD